MRLSGISGCPFWENATCVKRICYSDPLTQGPQFMTSCGEHRLPWGEVPRIPSFHVWNMLHQWKYGFRSDATPPFQKQGSTNLPGFRVPSNHFKPQVIAGLLKFPLPKSGRAEKSPANSQVLPSSGNVCQATAACATSRLVPTVSQNTWLRRKTHLLTASMI